MESKKLRKKGAYTQVNLATVCKAVLTRICCSVLTSFPWRSHREEGGSCPGGAAGIWPNQLCAVNAAVAGPGVMLPPHTDSSCWQQHLPVYCYFTFSVHYNMNRTQLMQVCYSLQRSILLRNRSTTRKPALVSLCSHKSHMTRPGLEPGK
jgi:hypothetical protein